MAVNLDKPHLWKQDVATSVDFYNRWFLDFAPAAFKQERATTIQSVQAMFEQTDSLNSITPETLIQAPGIISALRMATCPPLAVDRLVGLAGVKSSLIKNLEKGKLPLRTSKADLNPQLDRICKILNRLLDTGILPWLDGNNMPGTNEIFRSATIIADRLCGARANPIIRNSQEERQLVALAKWLNNRNYVQVPPHPPDKHPHTMKRGTFAFRMTIHARQDLSVNIPVDLVVQPHTPSDLRLPLMFEAKSAGDFTNTNKRRKEEAAKMSNLKARFGANVPYVLFLCGYFDTPYLGYEAAEGIDWIWEHRIDDLEILGL